MTVSIMDVAAYILARESTMVTMKLHKLAFYAQAAHLIRHASPLFPEDFHAWVVGPVSPELYRLHRGKLLIRPGELPSGNPSALTHPTLCRERALIDRVCAAMGSMTHAALSKRMSHELPCADAYARHTSSSLSHLMHLPIVTTDEIITQEAMLTYYSEHQPIC